MKQILMVIAAVALVGCGKKEAKVIEPEGDRQTVKQSVAQNTATDPSTNGSLDCCEIIEGNRHRCEEAQLGHQGLQGRHQQCGMEPGQQQNHGRDRGC